MSEELKPCPCGETPKAGFMGWVDDEEGYGFVECHANGLSVVIHARTEAEAREAWNTRTEPTDAVPTVGEVEANCATCPRGDVNDMRECCRDAGTLVECIGCGLPITDRKYRVDSNGETGCPACFTEDGSGECWNRAALRTMKGEAK